MLDSPFFIFLALDSVQNPMYSALYNTSVHSDKAIIVLPEIYGLKAHTKEFADTLSKKYNMYAFAVDHFFALNGIVNDFDYKKLFNIFYHLTRSP